MPKTPYIVEDCDRIRMNKRRTDRLMPRAHGRWHIVGTTGEPAFLNGTTNAGGTWMTTRFRWTLGGGWEYIINVNPPTAGLACFTLPAGFFDPAGDDPIHGFNSTGASLSFYVQASSGDVIFVGP